jgi:hypothetical protein
MLQPLSARVLKKLRTVCACAPEPSVFRPGDRVLVVRHFYDSPVDRQTLAYFYTHGVGPYVGDASVNFVVVSNGPYPEDDLPVPPGVTLMVRSNHSIDFGGWSYALRNIDLNLYDFVVFVNGTVLGPLIPTWNTTPWISALGSVLTETTRLAGCTININLNLRGGGVKAHVQSMVLMMSMETLRMVQHSGFFVIPESVNMPRQKVIDSYEVSLSQFLLLKGYNIGCLLQAYNGIDWRKSLDPKCVSMFERARPNIRIEGNPWFGFYGGTINPLEVLFTKWKTRLDNNAKLWYGLDLPSVEC